ncbi:MAG: hypothetical protein KF893_15640 [Caldilineaceae bacterium]|nr:hypothetical protein [Caldilineaceae bacterium]
MITQTNHGPAWDLRGMARGASGRSHITRVGGIAIKMLVNSVAISSEVLSIIIRKVYHHRLRQGRDE